LFSLLVNPGLPEEQQFTIGRGTTTIGRTRDNAVFCLHKSLSRKHAQIDYDGQKVKLTDLQSKNGIWYKGKRVTRCELREGDSFRCGDITFLIEGATIKTPRTAKIDRAAQTLPSPFVGTPVSSQPRLPEAADEQRFKDKLFLLIRASELCVAGLPIDKILEELIGLSSQVLEADRLVLITLDNVTLEMKARVVKSFVPSGQNVFSRRVVDWVIDHGGPASFPDVSRDRTLPGDPTPDAMVRGALCVPINPGCGTIGAIYVDSLSRTDCFRPDDLALLRAIANMAAVSIEGAALRGRKTR
jgi:adenylate cyclase